MSAELAHQKADKHLCVALHRKLRIRLHPSTEPNCGIAQAIWGNRQIRQITNLYDCILGTLSVNKVKNDVYSSLIPIIIRKFAK